MHRSQRTGEATWPTRRSSERGADVDAAPSLFVQSGSGGSDAVQPAATSRSARPPAPCTGCGRRRPPAAGSRGHRAGGSLGQRRERVERARRDDLAAAVVVRGVRPSSSSRASNSASSPPMTALMPVGSAAAASAIARPRTRDEAHRVRLGQDAGRRRGGELADRVPGDAGDASRDVRRRAARHDRRLGGDDQRLGDAGVADVSASHSVPAATRSTPGAHRR